MPVVIRGSPGSFVAMVDDFLPPLAISAHQIAAVIQPGQSTIGLAGKVKRRCSNREINDLLHSSPS